MEKNKKEYLSKALLYQFIVCILLFALLFALKATNSKIFNSIEALFADKLQENIKIEDAQQVFMNIKDKTTFNTSEKTEKEAEAQTEGVQVSEYIPLEEPSLSAEIIASGGNDTKVSSYNDIPENVSLNSYELNQAMTLPLKGKITSEFGVRTHPISGDLRFHSGIDIAAEEGSDIYAAFDGAVVEAGYDKWNGNYIKLNHDNDIMTVYCHCKSLNVKKGDIIRAGEVIASVGSTGSSTGPHLHFEFRINNISYNPENALSEAVNALQN